MYDTLGDGIFTDQNNKKYYVDSGSIGCILVSDINGKPNKKLGNVVTFKEPFKTSKVGSKIKIGKITISLR
jgi:hypothetical protein